MMRKIRIVLTSILVLTQMITTAQAQKEQGSFRFVYNGMRNHGNLVKIEFIDQTTKEVINTFSMAEKNPYNYLDFPIKKVQEYGPEYKTYQVGIDKLKNNELPFALQKLTPEIESFSFALMWSFHSLGVYEDTTLVIRYDLAIGGYDVIFATCATFYILDRYGNVVSVLNDLNKNDLFEFAVTGQRYFICTYYPSEIGGTENPGYLAYDLWDNKLIDQQEFDVDYSSIGVRGYEGLIRIGLALNNNTEDLIYFDFVKNKKYSRNLHMDLLLSTKEVNADGIIYQKNDSRDTLFFLRDFKVEDIQ